MMRPAIALAMGDPAGISPELTARLLALDDLGHEPSTGRFARQKRSFKAQVGV